MKIVTHELKTWPKYFNDVWYGRKKFELRKNDRDFKVGDELWLREYEPITGTYSDYSVYADITYIFEDTQWLQPGIVVLAFTVTRRNKEVRGAS